MALVDRRRLFTVKEYLHVERSAHYKSEYVNGEIFAMAGASSPHNKIGWNLKGSLWPQLRGGNCQGFDADMRIAVDPRGVYAYADAVIVCGEPILLDEPVRDNLTNPRVIFEVLSPSTEDYDRGEKFELYKRIRSLTDYVLAAQDQPRVEHFRRGDGDLWNYRECVGLDAVVELDSIGCRLPLAELYDRVFPNKG